MKTVALLCILSLVLCGCASTQQTMTPPSGTLNLTLAGPSGPIDPAAQAYRQGPVILAVGCQIGITAKPVGLDILNPAVAANAAYQQGADQNQQMTNPIADAEPKKPMDEVVPEGTPEVKLAEVVPEVQPAPEVVPVP